MSQIERGKTRPTRETIEWLAQRLGVDADFLQNGVSTDERSRIETMLARAEALAEAHKCEQALEQIEDTRTAILVTGSPDLEVRLLVGRGVGAPGRRRRPRGDRVARAGADARRRASASPTSTARTSSSASASAATSFRASRRQSRCSTRLSSSQSARGSRATCCARRSSTGARAAGAASATTRRRARTSSARSSSPKGSRTSA